MSEVEFDESVELILKELREIGDRDGFIPIHKITERFPDNDELIEEVVDLLEKENYTITRSIDQNLEAELYGLSIEDGGKDLVELIDDEPTEEELISEEESEIKVSDFDAMDASNYQTDDIIGMYLHEIGQISRLDSNQEFELATRVQTGISAKEKLDACEKNNKSLSAEEKKELEFLVEDGQMARDDLINANYRLVFSVAKRYTQRGLPLSDLIQEGNFGLIKAVMKYDPTRGWKFSTYATWWIKQSIQRAIADKGRNVRIPVHMHEAITRLAKTKRKLIQELHRDPTIEELADEMKIKADKVIELQRYAQDSKSFDDSVGDEEDSTLIDLVADDNMKNPLQYTESELFKEEVDAVLQTLTPKEEMVIRYRYGIGKDRIYTLEEVGKIMGVTRERVRQIETKALSRLRDHQRYNRISQHLDNRI